MSNQNLSRLLMALTVLCGLGLLGTTFMANRVLTNKSAKLGEAKAQSQVADELQQSLKKNKADIAKYSELNTIAKAVVPQDKDQAQAVGEIVKIAADSGISTLSSITFPASTLGGAAGATSATKLTQLLPVQGISGVYVLPITVSVDSTRAVSYDSFITFLRKLESNRRTAQVSSINLQPDPKNTNQVQFTIIINEYIKP